MGDSLGITKEYVCQLNRTFIGKLEVKLMWFDEEKAYNSGTFKLGQEVYNTKDINHRFCFHKECSYCDNTGKVLIKGKSLHVLIVMPQL